ncbi:MAG: O-antigen ligase family protein [Flavobacterium sp.]|uniref:O-antigen ligase family protein n=1 Tax=Flavobacterium sp. TaxID=239 RepID=UPI0022C0CF05|nr:O-antigen ligase family protein [Flavobacterium sp.]MCZ8330761.1 O-antigen ligase family protein [Flavobacterium sp.]
MLEKKYFYSLLLHVIIGVLLFYIPFLSKLYGLSTILFGLLYIVKNQNKNNEVLQVAAYIVGSEALLRMTGGTISYEFSKYGVTFFSLIGMYFSGFSKNALPYWIFLILLIPGVVIATAVLNFDTEIRKTIAFNISGPVCLSLASIYCYQRVISFNQINKILLFCGLPIVSMVVYLILYTPDLKDVLINTGSNYQTSGGFGPNQVATILGLGMFIFFSRFLLESKTKFLFALNVIVFIFIAYRGLITFSRGGVLTGFIMIVILIFFLYNNSKNSGKGKISFLIIFSILLTLATWSYTSSTTGGLIDKRYANQDAKGREKESSLTGREGIIENEINNFIENPIFGNGVAKGYELRKIQSGFVSVSHNEITRMLAEHGSLGVMGLLILFFTPMILYLDNKQNVYIFCFLAFWLLTINHAAMRLAAPAFIYSLSLLKVKISD